MRLTAVLACALLLACSPDAKRHELSVFAAASLTESFTEIAEAFEATHSGVDVLLSFGPSSGLATQIMEGAPADVYASASPQWMDRLEASDVGVTDRYAFAGNLLVGIVPLANPAGVQSFADLARPGVRLVLATPAVPVGEYARTALTKAGLLDAAQANLVSNEEDVKAVVQKVLLGEADAGIVYRTDVTRAVAPKVRSIEIPPEANVLASYPIAVVKTTDTAELAKSFVAYVRGPGQATLARFGFTPP